MSSIGRGLLVLAGVGKGDDEKEADGLISRIMKTRLWADDNGGQWKKNVQDVEGEILCGMLARNELTGSCLSDNDSLPIHPLRTIKKRQQARFP